MTHIKKLIAQFDSEIAYLVESKKELTCSVAIHDVEVQIQKLKTRKSKLWLPKDIM
jgi:hypothetical protein